MSPDEARTEVRLMRAEFDTNGMCPSCACAMGTTHRANCQWLARLNWLLDITDKDPRAIPPMQGPNLKFGEPAGEYEIEIVPDGAVFFYRQMQINGGLLELKIPLTRTALAEMQALLNMLDIDIPVKVPNGRIRG